LKSVLKFLSIYFLRKTIIYCALQKHPKSPHLRKLKYLMNVLYHTAEFQYRNQTHQQFPVEHLSLRVQK